jgi:hypothetical protein
MRTFDEQCEQRRETYDRNLFADNEYDTEQCPSLLLARSFDDFYYQVREDERRDNES